MRLAGSGELRRVPARELEPWTRGIAVRSRLPGRRDARGELVRVDRRKPPVERPYLVRFEDGSEAWHALADVDFEGPAPFPESPCATQLLATRGEDAWEEPRLVPGTWRLQGRGLGAASLTLWPSEGGLAGRGEEAGFAFLLSGEEKGGEFEARLDYVDRCGEHPPLENFEGAWELRSFGAIYLI